VFFLYAPRRVEFPRCGVKVERLPWAEGKSHLTTAYQWFLAGWAKRLSWQQVAVAFRTSWANVFRSVQMAVRWGLGGVAVGFVAVAVLATVVRWFLVARLIGLPVLTVARPFLTFIYNYFFRLGFLDGREGLLLHLYHSAYVSWKYAKAWELQKSQSRDAPGGEHR